MGEFIALAKADAIPEGEARVYELGELRLAVCHVEGAYYCIEDVCTHDDGPLGEGCLVGHEIECPRHGARFDVRNGKVTRMPAASPVETFPLKIEDGQILVEVDEEDL